MPPNMKIREFGNFLGRDAGKEIEIQGSHPAQLVRSMRSLAPLPFQLQADAHSGRQQVVVPESQLWIELGLLAWVWPGSICRGQEPSEA